MGKKNARKKRKCRRKVKHASEDAAWAAIRHTGETGIRRPYKCKICGYWHKGRPPKNYNYRRKL